MTSDWFAWSTRAHCVESRMRDDFARKPNWQTSTISSFAVVFSPCWKLPCVYALSKRDFKSTPLPLAHIRRTTIVRISSGISPGSSGTVVMLPPRTDGKHSLQKCNFSMCPRTYVNQIRRCPTQNKIVNFRSASTGRGKHHCFARWAEVWFADFATRRAQTKLRRSEIHVEIYYLSDAAARVRRPSCFASNKRKAPPGTASLAPLVAWGSAPAGLSARGGE